MTEPEEQVRLEEEVTHVANVANAINAAMNFDAQQVARGLVVIATVMAGNDPTARSAVAKIMLEQARMLDPDMVRAEWN